MKGNRRTAPRAGAIYAAGVFAVGCVLGAVRIMVLVPHMGANVAVLLEMPVVLAASWLVSRKCITRYSVEQTVHARLVMGGMALVVLLLAEIAISVLVFHLTVVAYFRNLLSASGMIGLAGQLAFASFPLLQMQHRQPRLARQ